MEGKIKDVEGKPRVEVADLGRSLGTEISSLRVSMAWMIVAVATVLGGWVALLGFLS